MQFTSILYFCNGYSDGTLSYIFDIMHVESGVESTTRNYLFPLYDIN